MLILERTKAFASALNDAGIAVKASGYTGGGCYLFATDRGKILVPWEVVDKKASEWQFYIEAAKGGAKKC